VTAGRSPAFQATRTSARGSFFQRAVMINPARCFPPDLNGADPKVDAVVVIGTGPAETGAPYGTIENEANPTPLPGPAGSVPRRMLGMTASPSPSWPGAARPLCWLMM
jgi:hypothetical protein